MEIDPDPDELYVQTTSDFDSLIVKYAAHDVCFVGVSGARGAGKSFFCDKILNLAEVKGNHVHFVLNSVLPGQTARALLLVDSLYQGEHLYIFGGDCWVLIWISRAQGTSCAWFFVVFMCGLYSLS